MSITWEAVNADAPNRRAIEGHTPLCSSGFSPDVPPHKPLRAKMSTSPASGPGRHAGDGNRRRGRQESGTSRPFRARSSAPPRAPARLLQGDGKEGRDRGGAPATRATRLRSGCSDMLPPAVSPRVPLSRPREGRCIRWHQFGESVASSDPRENWAIAAAPFAETAVVPCLPPFGRPRRKRTLIAPGQALERRMT